MMKQLHKYILKWFLPVLFISYMAGITLFMHSHVVDRVTVVHSHPFKKDGGHTHTTVEFQLIHLLNHLLTTDFGLTPLLTAVVLFLLHILFTRPRHRAFRSACQGIVSLRAPPTR
ncbi:hypothetical protein IX321_002394 [Bacteroides pyogenes]|nr:hypothetical protein [Bacteroides pyogenes]MBR8718409.1 hypothetical protein [Bacteroides pyogenes]MBR8747898.1 hypothetical protein [Bacteroides pyogenes]MBR8758222.1 hypothetical protein [Bacteroides pyogenes]MBR8781449.1 hypothetical protein [Bacteroides pyogenes]